MLILLAHPWVVAMQLLNGLAVGMNLFITALGLTLVFGVMRVINFAHGALFMLGAYLVFSVIQYFSDSALFSFWLGLVVAMLLVACLCALIEKIALSRLYGQEHLLQLLFTFALILLIGDAVRALWGSGQHNIPYPYPLAGAVNLGWFSYPSYLLFVLCAGVFIALVFHYFLNKTLWGRRLLAAQWDRQMLSALGINIHKLYGIVFAIGGGLAALGGGLAAPRLAVEPGMGALVIIDCFIIVIMGGMGSLWGSFWAAIVIGLAKVFGSFLFQQWEVVMVYGLLGMVMLWRPWGIWGTQDQGRD